jgi:hypothetical protein
MTAKKKGTPKTPPRMKELYELLADCVDVMDAPAYGPTFDRLHLIRLAEAIDERKAPRDQELLQAVFFALRAQMFVNTEHPELSFHVRRANRLAVDLKAILEERGVPPFIYHGTLSGHLRSIMQKGLVPGFTPVNLLSDEYRALAQEAVFFSDTWRGASFFAESALERLGAEQGHPVIVRVPEKGVELEEDPTAFLAGCVMVRGVVPTAEAQVFVGPLKGYPTWRPLAKVVGAK